MDRFAPGLFVVLSMVSWISHALLGLVLVCGFLLVLAWAVRPAHVQIRFTRMFDDNYLGRLTTTMLAG